MSIGNFSQTYAEARGKFLAAADAAGLDSHPHPLLGRDGEDPGAGRGALRPGRRAAVLLVSSGCHGVEGFCGSGVQVTLLQMPRCARRRAGQRRGHALPACAEPLGFSWWRRTTHENVDLNRNFQDFSQPLPRNTAYDSIAHLLVPADWPPTPAVQQATQAGFAAHGLPACRRRSGRPVRPPRGPVLRRPQPDLEPPGGAPGAAATTDSAAPGWPGSTCTPAWAPAAMASASSGRDDAATMARARAWWGGPDGR
jgi:hypothetical protein